MKIVFISLLSVFCLSAKSQVNKGMPDIEDLVRIFFSKYAWTYDGSSDIQFEKRVTGWYIRQDAVQPSGRNMASVKFWDRSNGSYNDIPVEKRPSPNPSDAQSQSASFIQRKLDTYQFYFYRRLNFYGYDGWDWDIMQLLGNNKPKTDSLLESFGLACSHYAMAYFNVLKEPQFLNGDSNRVILEDSVPAGRERALRFIHFTNLAIEAWDMLGKMSPDYKTINSMGRYSSSMVKMEAYTILKFSGYESEGRQYLQGISLPDTLMARMKTILGELAPNSILLSDKDAENAAVVYLQATGWRSDIIFIFDPTLLQRRAVIYLDSKYPGTLLGVNRSVYMNPKYTYSFHDKQKTDNPAISLNEFLDTLSNSAALRNDNEDPLMYSSKNIFLEVDKKKAEQLYGSGPFQEKLLVPMENDYLLMSDMIWLSIVNKNFLRRKIYFLYPYFQDLKDTGILNRGLYFELTPIL
jgi:hypothetical protein